MIEAMAPRGLRERKKRQTRARIIDVALDLCEAQGFERTTVDQIANAADVSPRTVNRYFETKEDVILAPIEDVVRASTELHRAQPITGDELRALRDTHLGLLDRIIRTGEPVTFERFQQVHRVLRDAPAVSARSHDFVDKKMCTMAEVVAERLGTSANDLRVRLIIATWRAIVDVAMADWDRQVFERGTEEAASTCSDAVKSTYDAFTAVCLSSVRACRLTSGPGHEFQ